MTDGNILNAEVANNSVASAGHPQNKTPFNATGVMDTRAFRHV